VTASASTMTAAPRPFAQPVSLGRVAASSALIAATTLTVTMAYLAIAHLAGGKVEPSNEREYGPCRECGDQDETPESLH